MSSENKEIPEILTRVNQEKFRRRTVIVSRAIAVLLILAIVWIGYVQFKYANEVNEIKGKYGPLGYCYYCGLETYRKCECQYIREIDVSEGRIDFDKLSQDSADYNIQDCPFEDNTKNFNTSELTFNQSSLSSSS